MSDQHNEARNEQRRESDRRESAAAFQADNYDGPERRHLQRRMGERRTIGALI